MSLIEFDNVSFGYPDKDLYDSISFTIEPGDHTVLIGSNGSGKSTLLKLMMTEEKYTYEGAIHRAPHLSIGYVSQFIEHEMTDIRVFDFLAEPFVAKQRESDELAAKMGEAEDPEPLYAQFQAILDWMEAKDGYNYEVNIRKQLAAAGLADIEGNSMREISGGEFKLLYIMKSMLLKPQLLIMDEPDVFLDFENLIGLTKLINSYDGTILAVTHSRLLLSQCFDQIFHIENQQLQDYAGTFTEYSRWLLENRIDLFERALDYSNYIDAQQKLVEKLRKSAEFTSDPKKGRQLQARKKLVERMRNLRGEDPFLEHHEYEFALPEVSPQAEAAAQAASEMSADEAGWQASSAPENVSEPTASAISDGIIEVASEATASNATPAATSASPVGTTESEVSAEANLILAVENYSLAYDDKVLLQEVSFEVRRGDRIALVGANGTGKSSLLRDIYGMLQAHGLGDETSFFRQIVENDGSEKLSGGERNLRQLREICDSGCSILLLDEPTSHLDCYAQAALEKALQAYRGTIIMVSHDFFTVTGCADRILLLENGTIRETSGRAYRKSIYRQYFDSDVFEAERQRLETEEKVKALIRKSKFDEARALLGMNANN